MKNIGINMKYLWPILALAGFGMSIQAANKPNIVLIMADDLGYNDVGFHGSTVIKTPHLDRLAAIGTQFSDAHVTASVCSPSRAGMMTGRYQQRFGHEANCPPRHHGMDPEERTLGQALLECGYTTAVFGKWHLGNAEHRYPTVRGFDLFWGLREGSRNYWYNSKKDDQQGNPHAIEHNGKRAKFEGHLTDALGDKTVKFIEACKDKPFFAFLSFTAPHGPLQSKKEDMEALGTKDQYAGLIYGMDRNIGKVLKSLEDNNLMDNTIIWFLSDNGGTVSQASNRPLGGKKGTKFEGGHRVPFILYWKDKVPAGKVYAPMVSSMDIFPTCVKAAGGNLKQERPLDGVYLLPFVTGTNKDVPHKQLYFRKLECAAMRDGKWKLIRVEKLGFGLYDLDKDIGESTNLALEMPEKVTDMSKALKAWEADKAKELGWKEGARWTKVRYDYHKAMFETGKPPQR